MLLRRLRAAEKRNATEALSQGGNDVTEYETGGYLVWGTVADFAGGEVRVVDMPAAEKAGVLHCQDSLVTLAEGRSAGRPLLQAPLHPLKDPRGGNRVVSRPAQSPILTAWGVWTA